MESMLGGNGIGDEVVREILGKHQVSVERGLRSSAF